MRKITITDGNRFSRRDFLKLAGVEILFTAILDACGSVGQIIATATKQSTTTEVNPTKLPTKEPTPSVPMIEVGGYQIPKSLVDLNAIAFAKLFKAKPEDVIAGVTTVLKTAADGKQYLALTTGDHAIISDSKITVTNVPLLIAEKNEKGEWVWAEANFKGLDEKIGILIGTSVDDAGKDYLRGNYRTVAGGDFSVLFVQSGFWSEDLSLRPEVAQSFTDLANQTGDILYIAPGIWVEDQSYLKDCKTKEDVIAGIKERASQMMKYINLKNNIKGKPTYVNIHNEAFFYFLGSNGVSNLDWKPSIAHKFLGRDVLVETYLAFLEVAKGKGFEVGKDVVFTFSEGALDTDNPKTRMALREYTYTRGEIAKRLAIPEDQVHITFAFEGRYDANNPYDQTSNYNGATDNGRWRFPGKDEIIANRSKFKPLFDELIFTETAFKNYTAGERRDLIKEYLEAAKETGASMVIFEAPLLFANYKTPDISAENLGFFTQFLDKDVGYYAFTADMLSLAG